MLGDLLALRDQYGVTKDVEKPGIFERLLVKGGEQKPTIGAQKCSIAVGLEFRTFPKILVVWDIWSFPKGLGF